MDPVDQLRILLEFADAIGLEVRQEPVDGHGGGLCRIGGRMLLFVDTLADAATQLESAAMAIAGLPDIDQNFLRPDLRELVSRFQEREAT